MTPPLTVQKHGKVAVISLNNPPVNALSHAVRQGLVATLGSVNADPETHAVVIRCEGRTFVAGADIREFGRPPLAPDVPELIELIDQAPKPVIAAMHGTALGGGLELALACHYRVCVVGTKLGLPEVTLGILPGAGGTQRLPRLVGAAAALDMIVGGAMISAARAQQIGLVDGIVDGDLAAFALELAARVLSEARSLPRVSQRTVQLDDPNLFADFGRRVAREQRGFLAPLRCIDAVRAAVELPFAEGLEYEHQLFVELMASPQSKAQRHAFFGEREVAKVPDLPDDTATRTVRTAAVIGNGALAKELAHCLAGARLSVTELGWPGTDASLAGLHDVDLLIEAMPDVPEAKHEVLGALAALLKPTAILATSSAWLPVDELVGGVAQQGALVGLHFPSPVAQLRLLEVVRGRATANDTYATVMKLAKSLGKVAVPLRAPLLGRLQTRGRQEAMRLQEEGASLTDIDGALQEFGFPLGRFTDPEQQLASAAAEEPKRVPTSTARAVAMHAPEHDEIVERCVYAIANEGARALDAGIALRPLDVDMVCLHGLGFPSYRGGALFYVEQVGLRAVHDRMLKYREQTGDKSWTPAQLIVRRLEQGKGLYFR
jgi:3-hydroxyacyl-CoA dehydrogenase